MLCSRRRNVTTSMIGLKKRSQTQKNLTKHGETQRYNWVRRRRRRRRSLSISGTSAATTSQLPPHLEKRHAWDGSVPNSFTSCPGPSRSKRSYRCPKTSFVQKHCHLALNDRCVADADPVSIPFNKFLLSPMRNSYVASEIIAK